MVGDLKLLRVIVGWPNSSFQCIPGLLNSRQTSFDLLPQLLVFLRLCLKHLDLGAFLSMLRVAHFSWDAEMRNGRRPNNRGFLLFYIMDRGAFGLLYHRLGIGWAAVGFPE